MIFVIGVIKIKNKVGLMMYPIIVIMGNKHMLLAAALKNRPQAVISKIILLPKLRM